ncbi:MAG: ring-hydroxylating dioxygenase subunit beta [Robiginitomaculum sp.]|nr:MAG: ring-hydroxylating dioxygenase subunit beta [Robiginitomaculum sp.]
MTTNKIIPADILLHHEVSQFIFHEAKLQDEHEYDAWEALWADDGVYWIPANGTDIDPEKEMSIIYDNRSRIALRIRQFHTGKRYAQEPKSGVRRVTSNIEVTTLENGEIEARANSIIFEANLRGEFTWACRYIYNLRRKGDGFEMKKKTVLLANNDKALYTLAFLV